MLRKIIILNPVNYGRDTFRVPVGLLTIASICLERGVDVVWLDADAMRDQPDKVKKKLLAHRDADLLAMGGLHSSYRSMKEITQWLDEEGFRRPILVGGKIAQTLDHLIWDRMPNVTAICRQEGEHVIDELIAHFPHLDQITGIEYRQNGTISKNPSAPLIDSLDDVPPLRWDLLDRFKYFSEGIGYILSSRGCPFACKFCRYPSDREKQRNLSTERILQEIQILVRDYGVDTICFLDEFFLLNKKRATSFCDQLEKSGIRIDWIVSSRADAIRPDDLGLLKRMRSLGCKYLNMGIESGSQMMLDAMGKNLKLAQIESAVWIVREAGIHLKASFIFGYPGETRETALESVRWRLKMGLRGKYFYATPYPGAPLYDFFKKKQNMDLDEEEQWILRCASLKESTVNLTDMSDRDFRELDKECRLLLKDNTQIWRTRVQRCIPGPALRALRKLRKVIHA